MKFVEVKELPKAVRNNVLKDFVDSGMTIAEVTGLDTKNGVGAAVASLRGYAKRYYPDLVKVHKFGDKVYVEKVNSNVKEKTAKSPRKNKVVESQTKSA